MKLKRVLCAMLSLTMLSGAALAADTTQVNDVNPMNPGSAEMPRYEVSRRNDDASVRVWGSAMEKGENYIYLENANESDPNNKIIIKINEDTAVVDAVTGEIKTFADMKEGEQLYAWVSPVMTRSMPPQSNAVVVICNIPADFGSPIYAQVQKVTEREDGGVDVLMNNSVILHLNADTELLSNKTKDVKTLGDIKPGTMLLSWYRMMTLSMPAQAAPGKVMLFPYGYAGYVDAQPGALSVNGTKVEVTANEAPYVHEGKLMVPVRKFAEALGYTVRWDAADPEDVTAEKDGKAFCVTAIGSDTMTVDGDKVFTLSTPVVASNRVTFMCIDDLLGPYNVKAEAMSAFG